MRLLSYQTLENRLRSIDGRGYKAYKSIAGAYDFGNYRLKIDYVQGDPFASPSRLRLCLPKDYVGIPEHLYDGKSREVAVRDFLNRSFVAAVRKICRGDRGSGKSGLVSILNPGQQVLSRSSVVLNDGCWEVRFTVGLPARGRIVLGHQAAEVLLREIPALVESALVYRALPAQALRRHVETVEDQDALREQLQQHNLVAFVANGSILPRFSGVDDRPLPLERGAVPFVSPPSFEVELSCPNSGKVKGMGIPQGITLIVGGGFHGKSTLLNALTLGVYNHIPGDGREKVVILPEAVKVRAEDGRRVEQVDISGFIGPLPGGKNTACFCTDNASGSTSQAANIAEALEAGARVLLIDEDTSATNFMVRDARMQALVHRGKEPIIPLIDRAQYLFEQRGVSIILVMGGSGDYLDVAHQVIGMDEYRAVDLTSQAREVCRKFPSNRIKERADIPFSLDIKRYPRKSSFDASRGKKLVKIDVKTVRSLFYGRQELCLDGLEQLVETAQTRALGLLLYHYGEHWTGRGMTLREGLDAMMQQVKAEGFDLFSLYPRGDLAMPRIFEVAGAINRLRSLQVERPTS